MTPSLEDIVRLRDAYEELQALRVVHKSGPYFGYADGERAMALWQEHFFPAVALVKETTQPVSKGRYAATAPSAWHAYFYLRAQYQSIYRGNLPMGELPKPGTRVPGEHVFFRGQRDATWPFVSSLSRRPPDEQAVEQRAAAALIAYFAEFGARNEDIPEVTGRCFAQHYGIRTELADVTCEPDIAVWFASHEGDPARPVTGGADAMVRTLTWAALTNGSRAKCLIAPPYVRNVYAQRGLFIDTSPTSGRMEASLMLDVRFPHIAGAGEFRVFRDQTALDVWPPMEPLERELVEWARHVARACGTEEEVWKWVTSNRDDAPDFWMQRGVGDPEEFTVPWLRALDWVLPATCVTSKPVTGRLADGGQFEFYETKIQDLVRSNRGLFSAFAGATENSDLSPFPMLAEVLRVARGELGV